MIGKTFELKLSGDALECVFGRESTSNESIWSNVTKSSVVDRQKGWVGAYEREREICMRVFGAQAT